jgi:hypothetical protein
MFNMHRYLGNIYWTMHIVSRMFNTHKYLGNMCWTMHIVSGMFNMHDVSDMCICIRVPQIRGNVEDNCCVMSQTSSEIIRESLYY